MERLRRDGIALAFEDVGKGTPPILLVHDLGCDHTWLQPQLKHFRGRHRVVAVDFLGHGQSDRLPQPYTLVGFADDLAWLCYELGVYRPIAVGQGIGGMIAIELARRWPNLLAAVVMLDAPFVWLPETSAAIQEIGLQRATAAQPEAVPCFESRGVWRADDSQHETFVAAIAETAHLAATRENAMAWDAASALACCTVPVLYVQAQARRTDVKQLRTFCRRIVVEAVRHDCHDQHAAVEQVNALIDAFLQTGYQFPSDV